MVPHAAPLAAGAPSAHVAPGPPPQQPQGLPPVGREERAVSDAASQAVAEAMALIERLGREDGLNPRFEAEASAQVQERFRKLREAISDLGMAVEEQDT